MADRLRDVERRNASWGDVLVLHHDGVMNNLDTLAALYARLNTQAFALEQPTKLDEARQRLTTNDLLILALDAKSDPVGFATYQLIPSQMGKVIYQARGLTAEAQGKGFGARFPQIAAKELKADYLVAKAQNPISIWSTVSADIMDVVYPLHEPFSSSPEMLAVLWDTVIARGKEGEVNLETGVHKFSYPMGKLGDFNPDPEHPGVAAVQQRLLDLGVTVANGDAIYYGGKIT